MRIVLTATEETSARLAEALRLANEELRGLKLEVAICPLVRVEPLAGPPIRPEGYDWVVLTSRAGVDALFGRLEGHLPRVAVVGPGTAEALRERGVEPTVVARRSTQEGLAADLPRPAGRVLFAGAEGARDVLLRELEADFVPLYSTSEISPEAFPQADLVVLASASAARSFARLGLDLPCVSIGPVSSEEARRQGLRVVAEAMSHDRDGLVRAVKLAASRVASSHS